MSNCKQCGSHAINHTRHGRDGSDGDLCDVCYWRKRALIDAQLVRLTDIEILDCWLSVRHIKHATQMQIAFARAVEAAHHVKASQPKG